MNTGASTDPAIKREARLWANLLDLLGRAPSIEALNAHGLLQLGLRRWRQLGRPFPEALRLVDRGPAITALAAPVVLSQIRAAYDGRLMLIKGPLVAALYPDGMRAYSDLDLIVDDAGKAQQALIGAGFYEVDEPELFEDIHHLRPLQHPVLPLQVELHMRPKWPERLEGPTFEELFEAADPTAAGVADVLAPAPIHHAVLLAAHGWGHGGLRSLRDLADVAAAGIALDPRELERVAAAWQLSRIWQTTQRAAESLLLGERQRTVPLRTWARHLPQARERTVLEAHLDHWLSPFWGLPARPALAEAVSSLVWELKPVGDETWRDKTRRSVQAVRRSFVARSAHERELGELATRGDLRRIVRERREAGVAVEQHETQRAG